MKSGCLRRVFSSKKGHFDWKVTENCHLEACFDQGLNIGQTFVNLGHTIILPHFSIKLDRINSFGYVTTRHLRTYRYIHKMKTIFVFFLSLLFTPYLHSFDFRVWLLSEIVWRKRPKMSSIGTYDCQRSKMSNVYLRNNSDFGTLWTFQL